MTDIIDGEIMSPEQLELLKAADETVSDMLARYATTIDEEKQLEAWLEQDPNYLKLQEARTKISELEERIKKDMKESSCTNYENAGYEAVMVLRHGAPTVTYDIKHIEEEPWGSACVVKAVDAKVFNAIIKAKGLEADIELYCQTEPGKESKAVTIRPVVVKAV